MTFWLENDAEPKNAEIAVLSEKKRGSKAQRWLIQWKTILWHAISNLF